MTLRDEAEKAIRAWDACEADRGASPVIDFDCHPEDQRIAAATSRLSIYRRLNLLKLKAEESDDSGLVQRLNADLTYLGALLGERLPLADYIRATQGCDSAGWPKEYVSECGESARDCTDALGVSWGPGLPADLDELGGKLDAADAPDAIRQAAMEYEPAVREMTGTDAPYELVIETTDVGAYWAYWLDGAGQQVRLRLNLRNAYFSQAECRQFALHEILGHGLQSASFAARCAGEDVPWVRLMSVHAPQQVMLEGLAEAMPLFITPDDESLTARVRLNHYTQLVRAGIHLALDSETIIEEIAARASTQVPWWTEAQISDMLTDRGANPQLRSYLWSYPAGLDWFVALADAGGAASRQVLQAAYREPLSPTDLTALWPAGPPIGGPGSTGAP